MKSTEMERLAINSIQWNHFINLTGRICTIPALANNKYVN